MEERLFLYIDILGFSELVDNPDRVREVYELIDNLHVFEHAPYFKCIVFSDTILVYSDFDWRTSRDRSPSIMWMCEFAQDLFYRLIGKDIHFRAILTYGDFEHHKLGNIESFFGAALVRAYRDEKDLPCTGLFMDNRLVEYSNIFYTTPYSEKYHFVHIMQHLIRISHDIEYPGIDYPIPNDLILPMGTEWLHAYDLVYLANIYRHMNDTPLHPHIRAKYLGTWQMLRAKSAALLDAYERGGLDPRAVCDLDWTEPMRRVGTEDGFYD